MNLQLKGNPHPGNWKGEHKKFAVNKISKKIDASCNLCHQKDYCLSCHKVDMPHSEQFTGGDHKLTVQKKGKTLCYNCHSKVFCTTCHE
jgi:hypothetical protein